MGRTNRHDTSQDEILAFHAALVRDRQQKDKLDTIIPTDEWEALLARVLRVQTRQTAQDKTWFMDRAGLVQRIKKVGVKVLVPA